MRGFLKPLIGDGDTLGVAAVCIGAAVLVLHTPAAMFAGAVLPVCLLGGAAYLARR